MQKYTFFLNHKQKNKKNQKIYTPIININPIKKKTIFAKIYFDDNFKKLSIPEKPEA